MSVTGLLNAKSFLSEYEIERQMEILESGAEVQNETRNYDASLG